LLSVAKPATCPDALTPCATLVVPPSVPSGATLPCAPFGTLGVNRYDCVPWRKATSPCGPSAVASDPSGVIA
jgi:hypothetical protein